MQTGQRLTADPHRAKYVEGLLHEDGDIHLFQTSSMTVMARSRSLLIHCQQKKPVIEGYRKARESHFPCNSIHNWKCIIEAHKRDIMSDTLCHTSTDNQKTPS